MTSQHVRHTAATAVLSGLVLGSIGVLGIVIGQPLLVPSLGPTVYLQAVTPGLVSAKAGNVFFGHVIGLMAGLLAVYLTGAFATPSSAVADKVSGLRVAAAVLAVALSVSIQTAFRVRHPPAAATTLLIALGAIDPTWRGALTVLGGITLVTVLGEGTRRLMSSRFPN